MTLERTDCNTSLEMMHGTVVVAPQLGIAATQEVVAVAAFVEEPEENMEQAAKLAPADRMEPEEPRKALSLESVALAVSNSATPGCDFQIVAPCCCYHDFVGLAVAD